MLRTDMPIFVDWLALTHLQTAGLFEVFLRTFRNVYVADELKEDTASLGDFEQQATDILATIDTIRGIVNRTHMSGKLLFGPYRKPSDNETEGNATKSSTLNLVADLLNANIVIVDDRSLNKTIAATDNRGHRPRLGTSLDLIEDLTTRGILSSVPKGERFGTDCASAGLCLFRCKMRMFSRRLCEADRASPPSFVLSAKASG
jgi:hypothetical protein